MEELPRDIFVPPPPEPLALGGVPLVWLGPLSRVPILSRGRWAFLRHARWRLVHIAAARAEVARRYAGADSQLSRRVERLDFLERLWRAKHRLAELGNPRLRVNVHFDASRHDAECERVLAVIRTCQQIDPPPPVETGQDFLDRLAELMGG